MLKEFKAFVLKGNVVDLAVAVVIGAAFGKVVDSLVKNLLTPLIAIPGDADFSSLKFTISGSDFLYGTFINELISFLLIAAAVFFFVVKPMNALIARRQRGETPPDPTTRDCPECLSAIPIAASRCSHCTTKVIPG
jgi:large conductance mechanosensitive channel